ncbi:MAG: ATP-binding cassette domain-containing protein [Sedimenticola sp.]
MKKVAIRLSHDLKRSLSNDSSVAVKKETFFHYGDCIGLTGDSGVGKTTLLNMLAGIAPIDKGTIDYHLPGEEDVVSITPVAQKKEVEKVRHSIGFVFQEAYLVKHLTCIENLLLPMQLQGGTRSEISGEYARIIKAMQKLSLAGSEGADQFHHPQGLFNSLCNCFAVAGSSTRGERGISDRFSNEISGGEMRRMAVIRATNPYESILLTDEPTEGLDRGNGPKISSNSNAYKTLRYMRGWVEEAPDMRLWINITHKQDELNLFSDKIYEFTEKDGLYLKPSVAP